MKKVISSDYFLFAQKALQCDSCDSCDSFEKLKYRHDGMVIKS